MRLTNCNIGKLHIFLLLPISLLMPSEIAAERICNGLSSNCKMRVNEITFPTSHNVMSSVADGFYLANNIKPMEEALEAGIRGLLLDSCDCGDNTVQFCHFHCALGTKDPSKTFNSIVNFMDTNPNEVLIIEIQENANTLFDLWNFTSVEFRSMMYSKDNNNDPWPTLNEMIDKNQRILVFQHYGGDEDICREDSKCFLANCRKDGHCPEGIHNFYDYGFQTPWGLNESDFMNFETSCQVYVASRGSNNFILNNHFAKDLNPPAHPDQEIAKRINTAENLQDRMKYCSENVWPGKKKNSLLVVDFWSIGDVVQVANEQNAALALASAATNQNKKHYLFTWCCIFFVTRIISVTY